MKLPPLQYASPRTLEDACRLLAEDDDAKIIAGGQSLMALLSIRLAAPSTLVDIGRIPDLHGIEEAGDYLSIGALTTHEAVLNSAVVRERAPLLVAAGQHIAHAAIRTRGTLGGSIAHGDGAGEWPLALLTLDGYVEVESVNGSRSIAADEVFTAPYSTSIAADEVVTRIWFQARPRGWGFAEVARRKGDYGLANVGVSLEFEGNKCAAARIVVGAAVGTVQRSSAAEAAVVGSSVDGDVARAAGRAAADGLSVISDMHGSREYRRHLIAALVTRTVEEAGARR